MWLKLSVRKRYKVIVVSGCKDDHGEKECKGKYTAHDNANANQFAPFLKGEVEGERDEQKDEKSNEDQGTSDPFFE